jgi:hypothetical protein
MRRPRSNPAGTGGGLLSGLVCNAPNWLHTLIPLCAAGLCFAQETETLDTAVGMSVKHSSEQRARTRARENVQADVAAKESRRLF